MVGSFSRGLASAKARFAPLGTRRVSEAAKGRLPVVAPLDSEVVASYYAGFRQIAKKPLFTMGTRKTILYDFQAKRRSRIRTGCSCMGVNPAFFT